MSFIPGLPDHLRILPPAILSADDPEAENKRAQWRAWDDQMRRHRLQVRMDLAADSELIKFELRRCAEHPAYFLALWGNLFEPRGTGGRGGNSPFLPYPFQVDLLNTILFTMAQEDESADLVVSKARDMGVSWSLVGFSLWGWLFKYPWEVLMLSYKQDAVDARSHKSLFWKLDYLYKKLPDWMCPVGFDPKWDRMKLFFENPVSGNTITGDSSTGDSGRADRATLIIFDEAAINDSFGAAWSATANTADHRIAASSENLEHGDDFYRLRKGDDADYHPTVVGIDWWQHPHHDRVWFENKKKRMADKPGSFEREVLRNAHAGSRTLVYPKAEDVGLDPAITYIQGMPLYVTIDPGFSDKTALVWVQENTTTGTLDVLNAYQNSRLPADFYGTILSGEAQSGDWEYQGEDLELMDWTKNLPKATYYGDVFGNNTLGATLDSFYTRLRKFGIYVNVDRTPEGQLTAFKMECRTYKGRREALRELIPRMRFADNAGSRLCLRALQENRFQPDDKARVSEPNKPLHDWTSHMVSALEYLAVNLRMRRSVLTRELAKPQKAKMGHYAVEKVRWDTTGRMVGD